MSEPIIEYRGEFNVMDFVSKYAERVSRVIDEQTLANVEHQLAMYGYVKVVRCRDCRWLDHHNLYLCMLPDGDGGYACWVVEPDGFCAWGERRVEGESE